MSVCLLISPHPAEGARINGLTLEKLCDVGHVHRYHATRLVQSDAIILLARVKRTGTHLAQYGPVSVSSHPMVCCGVKLAGFGFHDSMSSSRVMGVQS